MALQYIEIVMKAVMQANGGGSRNIANVFHYRKSVTGSAFNKANIESQFQTIVGAKVLLAANQDYVQAGTSVRLIDDLTDPPVTFTETGVGAIATDRMPDYNTVVVQLKTGLKGKSGRGSKHFAGVAEAQTTGDILTGTGPTVWGAVRDACAAVLNDSDGNTWVPIINSHRPPAVWFQPPGPVVTAVVVSNDITSAVLNLSLGIMKRRKVRTVV